MRGKRVPASYAHQRLGNDVVSKLPEHIRGKIYNNIDLFNIGLFGPDILFYYMPYIPNKISEMGYSLHDETGKSFFKRSSKICENFKSFDYIAYVYGFLCHFALDMKCHGFVDSYAELFGVSHSEIETEYDRYILVLEGKKPLNAVLTRGIKPRLEYSRVISKFFPPTNKYTINKALKSYVFYNKMLICKGNFKRNILKKLFEIIGKKQDYNGLIMNVNANPKCEKSNLELEKLYEGAKALAVGLIRDFPNGLDKYEELNYSFNSKRGG